MRPLLVTSLAVCACVTAALPQSSAPSPAPAPGTPLERDYRIEVTVRVAEVQVLVTDKEGNPVVDLKPEEVEITENGDRRKIAYLEPFATRDLAVRVLPRSTPLVGRDGDTSEAVGPVIPVPQPVRRVLLLLDAYNSRVQDREKWVKAARDWVRSEMRPNDSVGVAVLERDHVTMIAEFTTDKPVILHLLSDAGFMAGVPHQDYMNDMRSVLDALQTCKTAYEPDWCAFNAVQAPVSEWSTRGVGTIDALRRLNAMLAAIPGRKAVLWIGEGFVANPNEIAVTAILAVVGNDAVDRRTMASRLRGDLNPRYLEMLRVASASDVTYFTFDTRRSSLRDVSTDVDQGTEQHERRWAEPFSAMFDETRATMATAAMQTGGRAMNGPAIDENLPIAARAFEGLYTIGYATEAPSGLRARIKVKVRRRGVEISYPDRNDPRRGNPTAPALELAVIGSRPYENGILVPIAIRLPLDAISFMRADGGKHVASVGAFAEAVRPDGTRAGERYEMVELSLNQQQYDARGAQKFGHSLGLVLAPGPYRLRIRVSDGAFKTGAERAIDVTVRADGAIAPGIQEVEGAQSRGRESTVDAAERTVEK